MEVRRIKISTQDAGKVESIEIDAMIPCPGLAIHITWHIGDDFALNESQEELWSITHINSGLSLKRNVKTKKEAKSIALQVAKIIDWEEFGAGGRVDAITAKTKRKILDILNPRG